MILSQLGDDGKTKHPAQYGSLPMDEPSSRYSQPKLELFGLYRALRHWCIYIIGVKKLIVEVDAKYIKGMLNEPDLQPNATINRWIQGIKLFDFELVHVPAEKHHGPDALSRRPLAEGESIEMEDDTWLDEIALMTFKVNRQFPPFPNELVNQTQVLNSTVNKAICYTAHQSQNDTLQAILDFHMHEKIPTFEKPQNRKRFLNEFFVKESQMYKKNGTKLPLLVITDPQHKYSILLHAHENLGHRGIFSTLEVIQARFFLAKYACRYLSPYLIMPQMSNPKYKMIGNPSYYLKTYNSFCQNLHRHNAHAICLWI